MVRYGRPIPILERGALGLYLRQKRNDLRRGGVEENEVERI